MTPNKNITPDDLKRARRSYRITRVLTWTVLAVFALLAASLVEGALLAYRLGESRAMLLAVGGAVVLFGAGAVTLYLNRRQRRIIEAAATLLELSGTDSTDEDQ